MIKDNKDLLYKLYVEEGKSLATIASEYSASVSSVRAWLKKVGITVRPSTQDIYKELKITDFSALQKNLIVGSLLGDGSLTKSRDCISARFVERHSVDQLDYLQWKNSILKPFVTSKLVKTPGGEHIISGVPCIVKDSYMLSTITHPYLTGLHKIWYKDGKKVIPGNLYNTMNVLSYTVWFCDDGCFIHNKRLGIYRIDIHSEAFSYKENVFLCRDLLSKFFGVGFRVNNRTYVSGKAYYICISGEENIRHIVSILKPVIPDSMMYKFKDYL